MLVRWRAKVIPPLVIEGGGPVRFTVPGDDLLSACEITVRPSGEILEATANVHTTDKVRNALAAGRPYTALPDIQRLFDRLQRAARRAIQLVEQETQDSASRGLLDENHAWSGDGQAWATLVDGPIVDSIRDISTLPIDVGLIQHVQSLLNSGEQPLTGVRHLHNAERTSSGRFACIEAAIAAELAIKEVLATSGKGVQTLITELPSPPLGTLYGPVLKELMGQAFPRAIDLQKLGELRNELVHQPGDPAKLTAKKIDEYLVLVRQAIGFLLQVRRRTAHNPLADVLLTIPRPTPKQRAD